MKTHGWTVKPGGTSVCVDAAECGVPAGTLLNFNINEVGGLSSLTQQMNAQASAEEDAGIHLTSTEVNGYNLPIWHRFYDYVEGI